MELYIIMKINHDDIDKMQDWVSSFGKKENRVLEKCIPPDYTTFNPYFNLTVSVLFEFDCRTILHSFFNHKWSYIVYG